MLFSVSIRFFLFFLFFSILFALVRFSGIIPLAWGSGDLTAASALISIIGFIFSVVAGFIIQTKWNIWDKLVEASHGEITSFRQILLLAHHLPDEYKKSIHTEMKLYLTQVVEANWRDFDSGKQRPEAEKAWAALEEKIYSLSESEQTVKWAPIAYDLLSKVMEWRQQRYNYSQRHTPVSLKLFLIANVTIISTLGLLLYVSNPIIDYIFTGSIAFLAYSVYLLIDDLDHPYRPGGWHLSLRDYFALLTEINES